MGGKEMCKMEVGGWGERGVSSDGGQNILQKVLILVC